MTRRGWWLFAAVAVLWGLPYLFIRVAVQAEVAPVVVVWLRTPAAPPSCCYRSLCTEVLSAGLSLGGDQYSR